MKKINILEPFFFFLEKYKWVSSILQYFRQFLLSDVESFFTFMTPEVNKRGNREDKLMPES